MNDKVKHIIAGFLLSWTGLIITPKVILAGFIAGITWGTIKEIVDLTGAFYQRRTGFDTMDLVATGLGGLIGGVVMQLTGLGEYLLTNESLFNL